MLILDSFIPRGRHSHVGCLLLFCLREILLQFYYNCNTNVFYAIIEHIFSADSIEMHRVDKHHASDKSAEMPHSSGFCVYAIDKSAWQNPENMRI